MKDIKILICDDTILIRTLVRKALLDLGYTNIFDAEDGKKALDLILLAQSKKSQFNLVFMDWDMPNMNGLQVVQHCKTTPELADIPFIMISAEREHKNIVQALNAGVSEYIMKPFSPALLAKKIASVLKYSRQSA